MSTARHGHRTGDASSGLRRLRGAMLIQAAAVDAHRIARRVDRPGGGLVLTGRDGLATAQSLVTAGLRRPVLVDAARYTRLRADRETRLSESWIEWQRTAGLTAALTDSGYLARGDGEALYSVLDQAARLGPGVVAVLPLHPAWLADDIDRLCAEVAAFEVPIALVIEPLGGGPAADPLGRSSIVDGLLRLLLLGLPVLLLRGEVSALGLLSFGGHAVAVGLRESLRRGPTWRPATHRASVLVPHLLRFLDLDRLDAAILAHPSAALWRCDCEVCDGTDLGWLGATGDPHEAADAHAVAALLRLRAAALADGAGSQQCRDGWAWRCIAASRAHAELASVLYGLPPQPALGAWTAAARLTGAGQPTSAINRS